MSTKKRNPYVVIVCTLGLAYVFFSISTVWSEKKVAEKTQELIFLGAELRRFNDRGSYAALNTTLVRRAGLQLSDDIEISPASIAGRIDNAYEISVSALSQNLCIRLAGAMHKSGAFKRIEVNDQPTTTTTKTTTTKDLCNEDSNTLVLIVQ